jgi:hypothetical protein
MSLLSRFRKAIAALPGMGKVQDYFERHPRNAFLKFAHPGHFYSPIPDLVEIEGDQSRIYSPQTCNEDHGLNVRPNEQRALLTQFESYRDDCPFRRERKDLRYFSNNDYFSLSSALLLDNVLVHFRPKRIIEVGSGFSSAVMLDSNQHRSLGVEHFTFIDPYPKRLQGLINDSDRKTCRVIEQKVQSIPSILFDSLDANDLLFIDSSHVVKTGSDVLHLFFSIVPRLKPGVVVHIHDIYWPFEYPLDWLKQGICWNEAFLVKAFLQFNESFRIVLFNDYCFKELNAELQSCLNVTASNAGSSLFFQRVK